VWCAFVKGGVILLKLDTEKVEELAEEKGVSIAQLLRIAKMGKQTFYKVKQREGRASLRTVERIATVLEVDPVTLLVNDATDKEDV